MESRAVFRRTPFCNPMLRKSPPTLPSPLSPSPPPPISTMHRDSGGAGNACMLSGWRVSCGCGMCGGGWYAEVRRESGMHRCEGKFKDASVYSNETGIYCNKFVAFYGWLTDGSREMILTVWSVRPTARNLDRCSPGGTDPRLIHTTSADISFRSVYSFSWPDWRIESPL